MKLMISNTDSKGRNHRTEIFFKKSYIGIHQHGWQDEEKYLKFYQVYRKIFGAYYVKNEIYLPLNHSIGLIRGLISTEFVDMFSIWLKQVKKDYPQLFNNKKSDEK